MVSHPEPDILDWEVKRALRSTASGWSCHKLADAMKSQQYYSNPQRRMPSRFCIHYVSKSGRPSSGHRTGNGQYSSQFTRRVVLKNVQPTGQLHLSPMLVRLCLKFCMLGFSIMRTKNFQMSKLGLEKAEVPEIKLPTFAGS